LLEKKYWFLNADYILELFGMLEDGLAIRIGLNNSVIPNFEIKFVKNDFDIISLEEHRLVKIDNKSLKISPMELQIAFKLYLGSDKDIEDAVYLFDIFLEHINKAKLKHYMELLKVSGSDYGIEV